jgi:hypothetical protein
MKADDITEMTITEIPFGKFGITARVNLDIALKHGKTKQTLIDFLQLATGAL